MAQSTREDAMFIAEVNDAYRREQQQRFWRSFGKYIISISLSVVLATVAYVVYTDNILQHRSELTTQLIKAQHAIDNRKYDDARTILNALPDDTEAEYQHMAFLLMQSIPTQTKTAPQNTPDTTDNNGLYADYMQLQQALQNPLSALKTMNAQSPYYPLVQEMAAVQYISENNIEQAQSIVAELRDPRSKARVQLLLESKSIQAAPSTHTDTTPND